MWSYHTSPKQSVKRSITVDWSEPNAYFVAGDSKIYHVAVPPDAPTGSSLALAPLSIAFTDGGSLSCIHGILTTTTVPTLASPGMKLYVIDLNAAHVSVLDFDNAGLVPTSKRGVSAIVSCKQLVDTGSGSGSGSGGMNRLQTPLWMCWDRRSPPDTVLYVTDKFQPCGIKRVDVSTGQITTIEMRLPPKESAPGESDPSVVDTTFHPNAIDCTPSGKLIISCVDAHLIGIYVFDPATGYVTRVAGCAGTGSGRTNNQSLTDGLAFAVGFSAPFCVRVIDSMAGVLITDYSSSSVRSLTLDFNLFTTANSS